MAAAIVAAAFSITGCQGMATTTQDSPSASNRADNTVADWPLKFVQHNFGSECYDAYDCSVSYNGLRLGIGKPGELRPSLKDVHPDTLRNAAAGQIGIMNFPPPAQVRWRAKDGTPLEASVDIGAIFANGLIRHEVPREDIPEGISILNPDVLLVVNDRTIDVYMRAFIPTKVQQIPGNQHSGHRDDLVLAWSKTY
jgi:hypothetical protein